VRLFRLLLFKRTKMERGEGGGGGGFSNGFLPFPHYSLSCSYDGLSTRRDRLHSTRSSPPLFSNSYLRSFFSVGCLGFNSDWRGPPSLPSFLFPPPPPSPPFLIYISLSTDLYISHSTPETTSFVLDPSPPTRSLARSFLFFCFLFCTSHAHAGSILPLPPSLPSSHCILIMGSIFIFGFT
jgi:hypothetical protein